VSVAASTDPLLNEAEAEFASAAAAYERSIEKLRGLLEHEEPRWSPAERARCAERLAQLDDAIATSRELAHRSPGDTVGNEQLFAAYQQKITFLAEAVHRGGTFREGEPPR
jgi:PIN domain nuclease of toxin-antitoxin system